MRYSPRSFENNPQTQKRPPQHSLSELAAGKARETSSSFCPTFLASSSCVSGRRAFVIKTVECSSRLKPVSFPGRSRGKSHAQPSHFAPEKDSSVLRGFALRVSGSKLRGVFLWWFELPEKEREGEKGEYFRGRRSWVNGLDNLPKFRVWFICIYICSPKCSLNILKIIFHTVWYVNRLYAIRINQILTVFPWCFPSSSTTLHRFYPDYFNTF